MIRCSTCRWNYHCPFGTWLRFLSQFVVTVVACSVRLTFIPVEDFFILVARQYLAVLKVRSKYTCAPQRSDSHCIFWWLSQTVVLTSVTVANLYVLFLCTELRPAWSKAFFHCVLFDTEKFSVVRNWAWSPVPFEVVKPKEKLSPSAHVEPVTLYLTCQRLAFPNHWKKKVYFVSEPEAVKLTDEVAIKKGYVINRLVLRKIKPA